MKKDNDANFLPKAEKRQAKEALQKQPQAGDAEMKLVIPEMNGKGQKDGKKKKESFWQRRKRKKQEKLEAKMRLKGETGSVKEAIKKEKEQKIATSEPKPELFGNVKEKQMPATKPAMPAAKPVEPKKEKPAPIEKKPEPKVEAKPKKEEAPKMHIPKPEVQPKAEKKMPKVEKKTHEKPAAVKEVKKEKPKPPSPPAPPVNGSGKKMHQPEKKGDNFDGPSVNLVPDTMMPQQGGPTWILGAIILVLTVAVWVIIGGIGVSRAQKAEVQATERNNRLSQLNKLITEFNAGKNAAQTLQKQFDSIEDLIDGHLYWTPVMKKIEENTLPDVYYTTINADVSSNIVSLRAIAKNYEAAARQIRSFELIPDVITSVSIGEVRVENQPEAELPVPIVAFDLELTLTDGILTFVAPDAAN